jgi:hypothetical protein
MRSAFLFSAMGLALALAAGPRLLADAVLVFPDAETSFNPRVPCIAPVDKPGGGKCMDVAADFRYQLAPFVVLGTGDLRAQVRDNGRRAAKDIFTLTDGKDALALRVAAASSGGLPTLVWLKDGKEAASATFAKPLPASWIGIECKWDGATAGATLADGESVQVKLPVPFAPQTLAVKTSLVTGIDLEDDGKFVLDWTQGYAAQVEPSSKCTATTARLFGFDTFVISRDSAKRDCPMVQVTNGASQPRKFELSCTLVGEMNATPQPWTQDVEVPARSSVMTPLVLPQALSSDVYHLAVHSSVFDDKKNFLFVQDRDEPAGPAKFGLHDSARNHFGAWPDALPVTLSTNYLGWGTVMGPPWIKDPGMNADTPPEQWNWNDRIDWAIGQGLTAYVSLQSEPDYDWARAHDYPPPHMRRLPFGTLGGFPKLDAYRKFVHAVAERYKGKVHYYEVENEPMANAGITPADYVKIAQAVSEEIHAVDPTAKVFGICGTGDFVPWMTQVFALGGAKYLDGVSVHTYVTPNMPEKADLPGKLAAVDKLIAGARKPMPVINSETGTYIALREEAGHAISPERLQELIKAGMPNLSVKSGWPFHAIDERTAGTSVVRNAVYNFLAKAEYFTFFGYNPTWPPAGWASGKSLFNGEHNVDDACWAMISSAKDGERTPSLFTLAVGELTEQMKGADATQGKPVNDDGLLGAIFPKANGGEVAVLWSPMGEHSAMLEAPDSEVDVVSMLGGETHQAAPGHFRIVVGEEPVYVHVQHAGLHLMPSPVIALAQDLSSDRTGFHFVVVNTSTQPWQGSIALNGPMGWNVTLDPPAFSLAPGQRIAVKGTCATPDGTKKGSYTVDAKMTLPDGTPFEFPIGMDIRPSVTIPSVDAAFAWNQPSSWASISPAMKIDQPEQVAVGRSPLMASIQEEKYWAGPQELSAEVRLASSPDNLLVHVEVRDANMKLSSAWPGVQGSCVELFVDGRAPGAGLGQPGYTADVHQLLIEPSDGAQRDLRIWSSRDKSGILPGATATGARGADGKYWMAIAIPWRALGQPRTGDQPLGFDLGIDGPVKDGGKRKSQMMLFGTATDNVDTSNFGLVRVVLDRAKLGANK